MAECNCLLTCVVTDNMELFLSFATVNERERVHAVQAMNFALKTERGECIEIGDANVDLMQHTKMKS